MSRFGSLLDSSGPIGAAERKAAGVFAADETFFFLNGSSGANRTITHGCVARGEKILVDRNCHKCVCDGITLTGARPEYLPAQRNGYGLPGPVLPEVLSHETGRTDGATYAVVTNSTYDGICYDTNRVADSFAASVRNLHFDEAWFGHAAFHPLYRGRYAMAVSRGKNDQLIYSAQSTHKVLAALSQSSMIHVRARRGRVDRHRFNLTYAMHASTSPSYPMLAGLDVATTTLEGGSGSALIDDVVREAVRFRQGVSARAEAARREDDWFFDIWQPPEVADPVDGKRYSFGNAPAELLRTVSDCWVLDPAEDWHGFSGVESGYAMLDPTKVTVLCPGCDQWGELGQEGVPAKIVARCLEERGIIVEKVGHHTLLVLFSMGTTEEKSERLFRALCEFKELQLCSQRWCPDWWTSTRTTTVVSLCPASRSGCRVT